MKKSWSEGCKKGCGKGCFRLFLFSAIVSLLFGGFFSQQFGYDSIRDMRQLERIPPVDAIAVIPGEVSMQGKAGSAGKTIKGRFSGKKCFYVRWLIEEERTNDEGDTYWSKVDEGTDHVPSFKLWDETGEILVSLDGIEPKIKRDYRRTSGSRRY